MIPKLQWGLAYAVPPEATGAWGCRAIIDQNGHVDLVPDRTDQTGEEIIFDLLTREFPFGKLRETLGGLLRTHQVRTTHAGRFKLYESPRLTVMGDTNGSGGYAYLAARTTLRPADVLAEKCMDVIDQAVAEGKLPG